MAFDSEGKWGWDGIAAKTMDGASAAYHIGYRLGCYWVEELLVRDEHSRIIGKFIGRSLISSARVPKEFMHQTARIEDDRIEAI